MTDRLLAGGRGPATRIKREKSGICVYLGQSDEFLNINAKRIEKERMCKKNEVMFILSLDYFVGYSERMEKDYHNPISGVAQ